MIKELVKNITVALATTFFLWMGGFIGDFSDKISIPKGAVIAFNASVCPEDKGWKDYKLAYGRFIRGIDNDNSGVDPEGKRHAGNQQEDSFETHQHQMTNMGRVVGGLVGGPHTVRVVGVNSITTPLVSGKFGVETRPKNVSLLYCKKEN